MQNISVIWLKNGNFTVIDADMFDELNAYKWSQDKDGHVYRYETIPHCGGHITHWMHRVVNRTKKGDFTDHRNLLAWDNRRINLRTCSGAQNRQNAPKRKGNTSSVFKGVNWDKRSNKWRMQIVVNGRQIYGYFDMEGEAALAYNALAQQHFGEFARLNDVKPFVATTFPDRSIKDQLWPPAN